jgi:hypothetical protein
MMPIRSFEKSATLYQSTPRTISEHLNFEQGNCLWREGPELHFKPGVGGWFSSLPKTRPIESYRISTETISSARSYRIVTTSESPLPASASTVWWLGRRQHWTLASFKSLNILSKMKGIDLYIQIYFSRRAVCFVKNWNKCDRHVTQELHLKPLHKKKNADLHMTLPSNRSAAEAPCVYAAPHQVVNGSTCRQQRT